MKRLLLLPTVLATLIALPAMAQRLPRFAKPEAVCADLKDFEIKNTAQMNSEAQQGIAHVYPQGAMYHACLGNERQMRPWLVRNWGSVPSDTRQQCLNFTGSHQGLDSRTSGYGAALLASCVANIEHTHGHTSLCHSLEKIGPGLTTCYTTNPASEGATHKAG